MKDQNSKIRIIILILLVLLISGLNFYEYKVSKRHCTFRGLDYETTGHGLVVCSNNYADGEIKYSVYEKGGFFQ